jgi:naphthoate synthase
MWCVILLLRRKTLASDKLGPRSEALTEVLALPISRELSARKRQGEIWFLCDQYDAKEALDMGLVNKVVPLEILEETYVAWARKIISKSPLAIRMLKSSFNAELDGQAGIQELAGNATLLYYLSDEAKEGKNAFIEKREPDWSKYPKFP